ncbi:M20/M25/M40 family metallo-hydrolase [Pseudoalteromonas luteoviolacea]|uniref:Aminopeptidase n=1 Tax=Pseudoalteromonas luteoviolacea NCIMB 1942 TaxID=1365253 RepID=A0A166ZB03_9GAMM|nr:M20/M25/M40 family metallo-hydrolase [Pseudoalteromonas luteoviolacea]KZN44125.1 hypothetical protein N482_17710 [Pseudoalteromonas luteoviolacea NCIMB 1942]
MCTKALLTMAACIALPAIANTHTASKWITIESQASHHYQLENAVKGTLYHSAISNSRDVDVLLLDEQEHFQLSHFMHDHYHRCGGFVAHDSELEAQQYLSQLAQAHLAQPSQTYTIDNGQAVQDLISRVSTTGLDSTVNSLMAFYNRYYTQQSGVDASNWVKEHWVDIAKNRVDITVEQYGHDWAQPSVIATIPGGEKANEIVIIGGHLDSINSANSSNGRAPGADDNASGIAVLSEVLKAISDSAFKPKRTIQIMGYAAEEVGLRGSKAIAADYKAQGKNVVGMAQFDMSGNKGGSYDIVFITDYTNSAQNTFMSQLLDTYLPTLNYGFDRCGYGCSDHASWYQQGFAASFPFESRMREANRNIHTSNDTGFDASHSVNFAKLAAAYVAELAKTEGSTPPPPPTDPTPIQEVISGINVGSGQWKRYNLVLNSGYQELKVSISGGTGDADLYVNFGSESSTSSYRCRPYLYGNNESCTFTLPEVGTWYFDVRGYSTSAGVSLTYSAK